MLFGNVTDPNYYTNFVKPLINENVIEIQRSIGADIIMAFDECPPYSKDYNYNKDFYDFLLIQYLIFFHFEWIVKILI